MRRRDHRRGEGVVLGGAVGSGPGSPGRRRDRARLRSASGLAALAGGAAGIAIPLLGGALMAGSLDLLARSFPDSRLRLDPIGGCSASRASGRSARS
jgi:hypothetical protein